MIACSSAYQGCVEFMTFDALDNHLLFKCQQRWGIWWWWWWWYDDGDDDDDDDDDSGEIDHDIDDDEYDDNDDDDNDNNKAVSKWLCWWECIILHVTVTMITPPKSRLCFNRIVLCRQLCGIQLPICKRENHELDHCKVG